MRGLMFAPRKSVDYALVFEFPESSRWGASIHMFFVFFRIDAIFLDEQKKVVDIARRLAPFSLGHVPKVPATYLVEIPSDAGLEVKIGDRLDWP